MSYGTYRVAQQNGPHGPVTVLRPGVPIPAGYACVYDSMTTVPWRETASSHAAELNESNVRYRQRRALNGEADESRHAVICAVMDAEQIDGHDEWSQPSPSLGTSSATGRSSATPQPPPTQAGCASTSTTT